MEYRTKAFFQRQEIPLIDLERRMNTFDQVELGLDEAAARREAMRCMRCDICGRCGKCVDACHGHLGVSAIRFYHFGEASLILKDYVHGLPACIGCGACVNTCPTGALRVEDHGSERLILMGGTIINRLKLTKCPSCGATYVPSVQVKHVTKLTKAAESVIDPFLCPDCKRLTRARRMAGFDPGSGHEAETTHDEP